MTLGMKWKLLPLLCAFAACSSPPSSEDSPAPTPTEMTTTAAPPSALIGTWYAVLSDNGACGIAATFSADGTYATQNLCLISSTAAEDEMEIGTYQVTANQIATTPTKTSCPAGDPNHAPDVYTYQVQGNSLTLADATGAAVLARDTQPALSMEAIQWGCFDAQGQFQAQPLADVP